MCYIKCLFCVMWWLESELCEILILCYVNVLHCVILVSQTRSLRFAGLALLALGPYNVRTACIRFRVLIPIILKVVRFRNSFLLGAAQVKKALTLSHISCNAWPFILIWRRQQFRHGKCGTRVLGGLWNHWFQRLWAESWLPKFKDIWFPGPILPTSWNTRFFKTLISRHKFTHKLKHML